MFFVVCSSSPESIRCKEPHAFEMLASVGGVQPNADRHVKITRHEEYGPIPLPDAIVDPEKKVSTVEVNLGSLRQNINPAENILLQPYDVISVAALNRSTSTERSARVGGIDLGGTRLHFHPASVDASRWIQQGREKGQSTDPASYPDTNRRTVIEVNVAELFDGKGLDVPLLPGDIVYVPRSYSRQFWQTFQSVALPMLPYIIFSGCAMIVRSDL